jgi:hypothetical protein
VVVDNNFAVLIGALWALKTIFVYFWTPIAWVACAGFSWVIAGDKQYTSLWWLLLGILFGPVTLLAAAGLPDKSVIRVAGRDFPSSANKVEPVISARSRI